MANRGIKFQVQQRITANQKRIDANREREEREREAIKQLNRNTKENKG
jgi:hypothetical protein